MRLQHLRVPPLAVVAACFLLLAPGVARGQRLAPAAEAALLPAAPTLSGAIAGDGSTLVPPSSSCEPDWLPQFGAQPGTDGLVRALAVFDDGSGPALYVAGDFSSAGDVAAHRVARWDGSAWAPLGDGTDGTLRALAVFDDGDGEALYAAGSFATIGGTTAHGVARWDGAGWSAVGGGVDGPVEALAVFDDGGGPALYAGGHFSAAGHAPADHVAKWDGRGWSALGSGTDGPVSSLRVFDDGSGAALFAGGGFTAAGGLPASRVARWDGAGWSALGSGVDDAVLVLAVHDDGGGEALYAGGSFTTAGGAPARRIARWDGSDWSALGSGTDGTVRALASDDVGGSRSLLAGGDFASAGGASASHVARWDGAAWSPVGSGTDDAVLAFAVLDHGGGPLLYAGGGFGSAGGAPARFLARWDGAAWSSLGHGLDGAVAALAVFDDGGGPALHAGGAFTSAGGLAVNGIARWDGSRWSALGSGVGGASAPVVRDLAVFDDGGGEALYAAGTFALAGGVEVNHVARWDGQQWSDVAGGVTLGVTVVSLAVFDDGSGEALYAGGSFTSIGGVPAQHVARWDGAGWSPLGSGVADTFLTGVNALAVFDDGGGEALYAGGNFQAAGGVAAESIARWDGGAWTALGDGLDGYVTTLAVFDDGRGEGLYAGGLIGTAGGLPASNVVRWDGSSWSSVGGGTQAAVPVRALATFDDGGGEALYAGGDFETAGGLAASGIARWDGSAWSPLGAGLSGEDFSNVQALAALDGGGGPSLYVGGDFAGTPAGDSHLARFGGCNLPGRWFDLGGGTSGSAGFPTLVLAGPLTAGSPVDLDLVGGAPSALAVLFVSFSSSPAPFLGGTLHALPIGNLFLLATDATGELHGGTTFSGAPSGQGLWFQVGIADASVPVFGASLSNGVKGTVP